MSKQKIQSSRPVAQKPPQSVALRLVKVEAPRTDPKPDKSARVPKYVLEAFSMGGKRN
jgi:hypothetical protein